MRTRPRDRWALQPENFRLTLWDSLLAVPIRPPGEVDTARGSHTFGVADLDYLEIVERRRALVIEPFKSLTDVGFDGLWVTPYQISSRSPDGPALVALHWLEEETIEVQRTVLEKFGYLPDIRFNTVIDMALQRQGLDRSDIYVTQTFHLIPKGRSERIPLSAIRRSFDEVTQYELRGRKVIALGDVAARECTRHQIEHIPVCHPSRRGRSNQQNAAEIAEALEALGFNKIQSRLESIRP
jgi:hypothetical protein